MARTKGSRGWGHIRRLPSGNLQASYIGPDLARHTAPTTYTNNKAGKTRAEGWLADERAMIEQGTWTPPKQRAAARTARATTLADYAAKWVEHRNVKPRTRDEYTSKLRLHIDDTIGTLEITAVTPEAVRKWFAALGTKHTRRNSHAYGLLHAVLATAVTDGLIPSNPCHIKGVMNPARKREPIILSVAEVAELADAIRPERLKALVLLSAWCGVRWGEVSELRRKDIGEGCEILYVSRGVTRRDREYQVDTPKSGKGRAVVIPPHIRDTLNHHLATYVGDGDEALLFPAVRGGHMNDRVFSREYFAAALQAINRKGVRVHDLRHFAGTQVARVGNLAESMARLGHSTVKASLVYQGIVSGRDAEIAAALSELASAE
ncbi:tyrosine-type recombinase/integrase [Mycobacterium sp.]|uniref:tyrosine-type recombinase/integrase n=1 Tax=Mycobacterium sp. TaxID=1785 RepID=UPI003F9650BB